RRRDGDPDRATEVYSWFGTHADQITDSGAELHPVTTAAPYDVPRGSALELTDDEAERRLLTTRLHRYPLSDGS
ncbi:MAG: hypothetical protein Q7J48_00155, partial [Nocardioides sp.]|nr:hypothetical protein [Nocardioides sp.]